MDIFHPCDPTLSVAADLREPVQICDATGAVAHAWREILASHCDADGNAASRANRDCPLLPIARRGVKLAEVGA